MEGEAEEVGGKVEEKILIVVSHRLGDLTTPVPVAKILQCYKCGEKCVLSVATLQAVVKKTRLYKVICSRCAFKNEEFLKDAKYEPFTEGQIAEMGNIVARGSIKKGFGG